MDGLLRKHGCVCNCKDTNLKAIHNSFLYYYYLFIVVFATAKILIWKQFTTLTLGVQQLKSCVCNCKDTNLKAIHNRDWRRVSTARSCVCNCKDTNLKAIHNWGAMWLLWGLVVFATAKILIWKQFTTYQRSFYDYVQLCLQLQRY